MSGEHGEVASSLDDAAVVRSVRTDDGSKQVRQSAIETIVIRGQHLEQTTEVAIAGAYVTLASVTATEVRASLITLNAPPGPLDVAVASPAGTVIAAEALRLTPFVVAPGATGRGTFESPMGLCDPELEYAGAGAVIKLLAGTHQCDHTVRVTAGALIEGAGRDATVLTGTTSSFGTGFSIDYGPASDVTTIRRLAFAQPSTGVSVNAGNLVIDHVDSTALVWGANDFNVGTIAISNYRYEGAGTAVDAARTSIAHSQFRHCDLAVKSSSALTMDDVLVEDCALGVHVTEGGADIGNCRFVDNTTSVWAQAGSSDIHDSVIRANAGPRIPTFGILHTGGYVSAVRTKISGQADVGIALRQFDSYGHAALSVHDSEIVGGRIGIEFYGIENGLYVSGSTIRRQTEASLYISSLDGPIDLGTADNPGNNTFSVLRGGFVIDDHRITANYRPVYAVGNTLNGVSLAGITVDGPAELAPYYRIAYVESSIEF